jgi:cysteine desulfuration protein SufE
MPKMPQKLSEFLETLSMFTDENQRIDMLISYTDKFNAVPEEIAKKPYPDENKVPFCESGAYVWVKKNADGTLKLYFAVENPQGISAMTLAVILDKTLSGEKLEALLNLPDDLVYKIFGQGLSMGKNMGLTGIVQMIKRKSKELST